jgi:peptidoglycan-associated lipoprotein
MLSKTIKLGFSFVLAAVFLAGCASTSKPEPVVEPVKETPPAQTAPTTNNTVTQVVTPALETVFYFDFDKAELRAETRALLTAHAAALKTSPRSIRLEGHADERGTREYNMALGERRALAVRDFLRSEGVNSAIEVVSYGEESPIDAASSESAWALNRRVELK